MDEENKFYHKKQLIICVASITLFLWIFINYMFGFSKLMISVVWAFCLCYIIIFIKIKIQYIELLDDYLVLLDSDFFWKPNERKTIIYNDIDCVKILCRHTWRWRIYDAIIFLKGTDEKVFFKNIKNRKLFYLELKDRWIYASDLEIENHRIYGRKPRLFIRVWLMAIIVFLLITFAFALFSIPFLFILDRDIKRSKSYIEFTALDVIIHDYQWGFLWKKLVHLVIPYDDIKEYKYFNNSFIIYTKNKWNVEMFFVEWSNSCNENIEYIKEIFETKNIKWGYQNN